MLHNNEADGHVTEWQDWEITETTLTKDGAVVGVRRIVVQGDQQMREMMYHLAGKYQGRVRGDCALVALAATHTGLGQPKPCCTSCHEDEADGMEICVVALPDGDWLSVCCTVARQCDEVPGLLPAVVAYLSNPQ